MHIGHYISGAGHVGLISWLLFGSVFSADPIPFEVADVSVISSEDFAALVELAQPPLGVEDVVAPPVPETQPEPEPVPPAPEPDPEPVREPEPVLPVPAPEPDVVPDPVPAPPPVPEVVETIPEVVAPEPVVPVLAPERALRPVPRPAPRVAPEPVEQPVEDLPVAPEIQEAQDPEQAEEPAEPVEEATAPEAATTEIVTEADEDPASLAPVASVRPRTRPARAAAPVETAAATPDRTDAVADALAQALSGATTDPEPDVPTGPPLSQGERDSLRLAVQDCWVVDVGSQAANVTVTLAMSMGRDGRVVSSSLRLLSSSGGSGTAVETAFQAARRAVLRCQENGYQLPIEKYDRWKEIEMTFNPETMRLR